MMVFMPLVMVLVGQLCREVRQEKNHMHRIRWTYHVQNMPETDRGWLARLSVAGRMLREVNS